MERSRNQFLESLFDGLKEKEAELYVVSFLETSNAILGPLNEKWSTYTGESFGGLVNETFPEKKDLTGGIGPFASLTNALEKGANTVVTGHVVSPAVTPQAEQDLTPNTESKEIILKALTDIMTPLTHVNGKDLNSETFEHLYQPFLNEIVKSSIEKGFIDQFVSELRPTMQKIVADALIPDELQIMLFKAAVAKWTTAPSLKGSDNFEQWIEKVKNPSLVVSGKDRTISATAGGKRRRRTHKRRAHRSPRLRLPIRSNISSV